MTALAIRQPWWRRLAGRLRLVRAAPVVTTHNAGADFVGGIPARPGYDVPSAMSAYVAFPWVFACVNAISQDVASRPVRLHRRRKGSDEEIPEHPILDLLNERPSTRVQADQFHRQLMVDRILAGNSYQLRLGRMTTSLIRLHPKRIEIEPASDGQPDVYVYDGAGLRLRYPWEAVLHVSGASWADTPESLFGAGAIEALHQMLTADQSSWTRQAEANKQGKPDYLATPDGDKLPMWGDTQVKQVRAAIDAVFRANHGGVGIAPNDVKLQKLSWSPADLVHKDMREEIRDAVLASFGVPPTRVSLPTANYAQSNEQMRGYWQQTVGGYCAELDAAHTQVARAFDRALYVRRDFSDVPALQEDKSARLERVRTHWLMGATRQAAYEAEGLPAPEGEEATPAPAPPADEEERRLTAVARWLATGHTRAQDAGNAPREGGSGDRESGTVATARAVVGEQARAARWREFIVDLHGPTEARLQRAISRYLREQQARMVRRLSLVLDVGEGRAVRAVLSEVELERILDPLTEDRLLRESLGDTLIDAVRRAFKAALRTIGVDADFTPDRSPVASLIAALIANVNETTRQAVRATLLDGLRLAESIADLQTRVRAMPEFGPARALTIARTESTRAVSSGTARAYGVAADSGIRMRQEWLSARDGAVREAHAEMDGQVVEIGEEFTAPSGERAPYPGGFASAALSVNCRCTTLPVLDE